MSDKKLVSMFYDAKGILVGGFVTSGNGIESMISPPDIGRKGRYNIATILVGEMESNQSGENLEVEIKAELTFSQFCKKLGFEDCSGLWVDYDEGGMPILEVSAGKILRKIEPSSSILH